MKIRLLSCTLGTLLLLSCSQTNLKDEVAILNLRLKEKDDQITELTSLIEDGRAYNSGDLVHLIYFKLSVDADQDALIKEIKKLHEIQAIQELDIGPFKDLKDARALKYDLVMVMSFKDEEAYQQYQDHTIHLALKKGMGKYLAGPPASYDFMIP